MAAAFSTDLVKKIAVLAAIPISDQEEAAIAVAFDETIHRRAKDSELLHFLQQRRFLANKKREAARLLSRSTIRTRMEN